MTSPCVTMSKPQRAVLRNRKIGFVFAKLQLPAQDDGCGKRRVTADVQLISERLPERRRRAIEALQAVGLGDRLEHKSNQMSGGRDCSA